MPRLIDADKVAEAIAWLDEYDFVIWHDVQKCIDKVPTVEAEPVVRCKNCIHSGQCTKEIVMKMRVGSYLYCPMGNEGFCSHGERKEDE